MRAFLAAAAAGFAVLLALPMLHWTTGFPPDRPLAGVETAVAAPAAGWRAWWRGRLQADFEAWLGQKLGLRGALVRTANQIGYTLFRELAQGTGTRVVPGRAGYLYESTYVDSYRRGGKRSGQELRRISAETRRLQDRLAADGIAFWLVIAPSKAEILPEYLPAHADREGRAGRRSHYERLIGLLRADGVNVVDGHALFKEWKRDPSTPALFPRGGTHWNRYGTARVVSVLLARLRAAAGRDWPLLDVQDVVVDDRIVPPDNDLGELANLWQRDSLAGPQVHPVLEVRAGKEKPDLLLICDSFGAMVGEILQHQRLVRQHDAFYYNKRHQGWPRKRLPAPAPDENLPPALRRVAGRDGVVIVQVEYFLPVIGFGFAEELLKAYDEWDARPASGGAS